MKIDHIASRDLWEEFINAHSVTTFMQSWSWGDFEVSCGHDVYRFFVIDADGPIAAVQAILIRSKRGKFLYVPHGPILHQELMPWSRWTDSSNSEVPNFGMVEKSLESVHRELVSIAHDHDCAFIRMNSSLPKNNYLEEMFHDFGYKDAPIYLTSENAAVLNLENQDEDRLMTNMRKTTRYLIHKAEKEQVTVTIDTSGESIADFMKLYDITTKRGKFIGFEENYIKREFEAFEKYDTAVIINAYHKAQNLASALILFTKSSAFYHQGASNHPKVPAPYLLQWRAIQLAIERGCNFYNFWGTYIPGRTPKTWQGLSLFKQGFGTQEWSYLPTYDYPLKLSYYLTNIYERYVRLKRGV